MKRFLMLALAGLLAATGPALACSAASGAEGIRSGVIDWINEQRAAKGLKMLTVNARLDAVAKMHACDMADAGKLAHQVPGGPSFQARIKSSGYKMRTAVENIAKSPRSGAEIPARIWRDSRDHWANILNPALRDIGVAAMTDGTNVYYVFVGGAPR